KSNPDYLFEFSDGAKLSPVQIFKEFIDLLPKQFNTPPEGTAPVPSNPQEIANAAVAFKEQQRQAGNEISITDAVNAVNEILKNKPKE
ncbi:MAG: hypothetical protein HY965_02845, partial [Ignavibacteriales bacterium]|nr:hypothetical protein [Ignavibacteriales bacterium]